MNAKRQTIWLVSMLSLMVVLSAYYLFTEDVNKLDPTAASDSAITDVISSDVSAERDLFDSAADGSALGEGMSVSDDQVLEQYVSESQAKSGTAYLINLQLQRNDEVSKQAEELASVIADTSQTPEAVSAASEQLRQIERQENMVISLQDALQEEYADAVVIQDSDQWKVVVESVGLDKTQAINIINEAAEQLNIRQDQVVVQYVQ